MLKYWMVAVGGAIGATLRLLITELVQRHWRPEVPYGTVVVNLVGALCIGLFMGYFLNRPETPSWVKFLLVTGCLGGLTTFSTFSFEWVDLYLVGNYTGAAMYAGIQLVGGFSLCWLGLAISRAIW